ncbi:MAG: phage terminase small subunit [Lentisphaerota bacterium]
MTSPAWRHRNQVIQNQAAVAAKVALERKDEKTIQTLTSDKARFELLLTALENDCNRISALPKGGARTELKRELLKTWLPVINAYLAGDQVYQNIALTQVLVWCFDIGDINEALRLADAAIEQQQPMPERYKRNVKTYVADAILDWCRDQQARTTGGDIPGNARPGSAGNKTADATPGAIEPYFSRMYEQAMSWPIHDDIKLKYVRLAALQAKSAGDLEKSLELCEQAEKIDSRKAQVKTLKTELNKAIAAQQESARHKAAKAGK